MVPIGHRSIKLYLQYINITSGYAFAMMTTCSLCIVVPPCTVCNQELSVCLLLSLL